MPRRMLVLFLVIACGDDGGPTSDPAPDPTTEPAPSGDYSEWGEPCCKYCEQKPCGDSCISSSKTCVKGYGCACRG